MRAPCAVVGSGPVGGARAGSELQIHLNARPQALDGVSLDGMTRPSGAGDRITKWAWGSVGDAPFRDSRSRLS
jgi:hypothetical protein